MIGYSLNNHRHRVNQVIEPEVRLSISTAMRQAIKDSPRLDPSKSHSQGRPAMDCQRFCLNKDWRNFKGVRQDKLGEKFKKGTC